MYGFVRRELLLHELCLTRGYKATLLAGFTSTRVKGVQIAKQELMRNLLAAALLLLVTGAQAQYSKIRSPQDAAEIKLFKSLGVLGQLERVESEGKRHTVRARAFDSSGRVIADLQPTSSKYYM